MESLETFNFFDFRNNETQTLYFILQRRKGLTERGGLTSLLANTVQSFFDTNQPPFRILHQTPNSEVYYGLEFIICSKLK